MAGEPSLPPRLEAEVERIYLNEEYEFLTVTLRLADGRRMSVDFGRESDVARDVLEALATGVPRAFRELHEREVLLPRLAPPIVEEDWETASG